MTCALIRNGFLLLLALFVPDAGIAEHWKPSFVTQQAPNDIVRAFTHWDDGGGEALYVAGEFDVAGGERTARIARWNGQTLTPIGGEFNGNVYKLAVYQGDLIAAGNFTRVGGVWAEGIARWNGLTWQALGQLGGSGVTAVAVDGDFLLAGAQGSNGWFVAEFDGSTWRNTGAFAQPVYALAKYNGAWHAGGNPPGLPTVNGLSRWNGLEWQSLVNLLNTPHDFTEIDGQLYIALGRKVSRWNGTLVDIGSFDGDVRALYRDGQDLIAAGRFRTLGSSAPMPRIARWNGLQWNSIGAGFTFSVEALTIHQGELIAGGNLGQSGNRSVSRMAAFDGTQWRPLLRGLLGSAHAATQWNGSLIVGGAFTVAGGPQIEGVARWTDMGFEPLGAGLDTVNALAVFNNQLIAGGEFLSPAQNVARWDGSNWVAMGSGLPGRVNCFVQFGGELIAGGSFSSEPSYRVARWTGSEWQALGIGPDQDVYSLAVYGGQLYAAGTGLWRWTGGSWEAVGDGQDRRIYVLLVHQGELYVAGDATRLNGQPTATIARWNGVRWEGLPGIANSVSALGAAGSRLYAAGSDDGINIRAYRLENQQWQAIGVVETLGVRAIAESAGNALFLGSFHSIGGLASPGIAAFGDAEATSTALVGIPTAASAGQEVELTAYIDSTSAPRGQVSFYARPGGSCSDIDLVALNPTTSLATCRMRMSQSCVREITARYVGGTNGTQTWLPSISGPATISIQGNPLCGQDALWLGGFE